MNIFSLVGVAVIIVVLGSLNLSKWGKLEPSEKTKKKWRKKGII